MPTKECPTCKEASHVRTATCKCGYVFYTPTKKSEVATPEVVIEVPNEEVKLPPVVEVIKKPVKDPVIILTEESASLGYTLKDVNSKDADIHKRFRIFKNIGYNKYEGVFSTSGKITGAFIAS